MQRKGRLEEDYSMLSLSEEGERKSKIKKG